MATLSMGGRRNPWRSKCVSLREQFGVDHLWFADDLFGINNRWVQDLADHVERHAAAVPFKMQSRADLMQKETVAALARAGCVEVWMGVESGSQKILDAMQKGTRVEQVGRARENLRQNGIRACFFLQFGYPGETWGDIEKTIQMVRETRPDDLGISVSYPLPGTKFYERVREQLGEKTNWVDSEDLVDDVQGRLHQRVLSRPPRCPARRSGVLERAGSLEICPPRCIS